MRVPKTSGARTERIDNEVLRFFGLNAVRTLAESRPQSIERFFLLESLLPDFKKLLKAMAQDRRVYRAVSPDELSKLAQSEHHGGVVAFARPKPPQTMNWLLEQIRNSEQAIVIALSGVTNPHNIGAIYRSAAHFGALAVLLPDSVQTSLAGSAARVAEGGAETVETVRCPSLSKTLDVIRACGTTVIAASPYALTKQTELGSLPKKMLLLVGNEENGIEAQDLRQVDSSVTIPGTGAVESLNVSVATAVVLAAWRLSFPLRAMKRTQNGSQAEKSRSKKTFQQ